ncbi:MAG: DNA (cytosine-5-)-methyltransferase [Endomicrobiaceae bacterium]|nr:DNA (cytosine-5-)-methyltransferase [Endomicrobiaceae bacterium]
MKGISLFSNVGIGETYLNKCGIDIVLANEFIPKRAEFYSYLYPNTNMVCGDITNKQIFDYLVNESLKQNIEFLIATPPCQGMSVAGKMDKNDKRNSLIVYAIEFIKKVQPNYIIIENVPAFLKFSIKIKNNDIKIVDYIKKELTPLGYFINYSVLDAADYNTPQYRKRAVFLISKISKWEFPKQQKHITVKQAIGDLPSLESGEKSNIKYHSAKVHNKNHILWMKHTPTGQTAFNNKEFYPQKNGRKIKGYSTTYKRIEWDKPAPTITMCNGGISSQNNVHPGIKQKDGTYSDARVLSVLEIMRLTGLPDNWDIPTWASENFVRQVIGEGFPPKFVEMLISTIPSKENLDFSLSTKNIQKKILEFDFQWE